MSGREVTVPSTWRLPRRIGSVLVVAVLVLTLGASAASADAAGPTNYRSEVTGIEPPAAGVSARVYGGDAFIELTVQPGVEVIVPGYDDDPDAAPYLRIDADGAVFVNRRSPAAYLNAARYGSRDVTPPPAADAIAPPEWEQVASGGTYAWHDHRIHWMSPSTPPQVDAQAGVTQPVLEWELPLVVDGEAAVIAGALVWVPSRSPLAPLLVVVVVLAAAALAIRGARATTLAVVGVAALVALGLGLAEMLPAPPGAEADLLRVLLPGLGAAAALLAVALRGRGERSAVLLAVLGAVPLTVWALLQVSVFTAPVLVGAAPDVVVRYGVAAVAGAALGALVAGGASLIEPLPDGHPAPGHGPTADR